MTSSPGDLTIRVATPDDLPRLWEIRAASDAPDPLDPPPPGHIPPVLEHLLRHGTLLVAERDGRTLGFAGRMGDDEVTFLTDLFVEPGLQSAGVGQALLRAIFSETPPARCTLASTDPRAIALYARAGLAPRWPNLNLVAEGTVRDLPSLPRVTLDPCAASDPQLLAEDRVLSGRFRPDDFAFFVAEQQGACFWVRVDGERAGYAVVRRDAASGPRADTLTIGPVGCRSAVDARVATLAAVRWARERAPRLEISAPGPHPALPELLEAGFRIDYIETFCATSPRLSHPDRYVGSGGDLF